MIITLFPLTTADILNKVPVVLPLGELTFREDPQGLALYEIVEVCKSGIQFSLSLFLFLFFSVFFI
jgi:hypothetical protein